MPVHSFTHKATGETIDVYVAASAPTIEHQQQSRDGKVFKRVYAAPLAAKDTRIGDCTMDDFRRRTTGKNGLKVGDMWEESAAMSERRAQREGKDPVKEAYYKRYEEEMGEKHPEQARKERIAKANAHLAEWGVKLNV